MALFAFSAGGFLAILGDNLDNTIKVSRDASGALLINDGTVSILGSRPSASRTQQIEVFGFGGNDTLTLDTTLGALPATRLFGGAGTDVLRLTGSEGAEAFDVSANSDRVRLTRNFGNGAVDLDGIEQLDLNLLGGADTVTVNSLAATALRTINLNLEGTVGSSDSALDRLIVNGTNNAETIDVAGTGNGRYSISGLSAIVNVKGSEATDSFVINTFEGNDTIRSSLAAGVVQFTVDAGSGDDTLLGGAGVETFFGGDGNDTIDGNGGNDIAFLGAGDDVFIWDPGDGSDIVEGQAGNDTLRFNGSNGNEVFDVSAKGDRVRVFRDLGNIVMDLDDVERLDLSALGGSDRMTVDDLTGTDLSQVALNLSGDSQVDTISINGTNGNDTITANSSSSGIEIAGLAVNITIIGAETADTLTLNGLAGDDTINASGLAANLLQLTLNGGLGNDTFFGSAGDDLINGGDGTDTALMGAGNDTFIWNPGDDTDVVEGQAGNDTLRFNGANIAETFDVSANGSRVRLFRNIANVVMDFDDVERLELNALGGADTITIHNLTGTDLSQTEVNLTAAGGSGDEIPDTIIVNGSNADDVAVVNSSVNAINVFGLVPTVTILGAESNNDKLNINMLAGDDVVEASSLAAVIGLTVAGGDGNDVMIGGAGNDVLQGGAGDDVLQGGAGNDVLDGGPGDNVVIQ